MDITPRYQHDCARCQFLGHYADFDIYIHPGEMRGYITVVTRYSDDPGDYASRPYPQEEWDSYKPSQLLTDDPKEQETYQNLGRACFLGHRLLEGRLMNWPKE